MRQTELPNPLMLDDLVRRSEGADQPPPSTGPRQTANDLFGMLGCIGAFLGLLGLVMLALDALLR